MTANIIPFPRPRSELDEAIDGARAALRSPHRLELWQLDLCGLTLQRHSRDPHDQWLAREIRRVMGENCAAEVNADAKRRGVHRAVLIAAVERRRKAEDDADANFALTGLIIVGLVLLASVIFGVPA